MAVIPIEPVGMDRGVWYDAARVERTVTKKFVCSHLLPDEIENLDRPLAFGDGLTNCTYWEWIQEKAKRLFLILVDLGVPDQIFGVVDDSWEDEDLPIPRDHVDRLALTAARDSKFDSKFYARQFFYLIRKLRKGEHVQYRDDEVVPIDIVERRLTHNHTVERVELPDLPGRVFCRRRFSLNRESEPACLSEDDFMSLISSIKNLQHDHMFSYWTSYTYQGHGFILFHPVGEYKLSSFLANNQSSLKNLDKLVRRRMILDWIHCLVDTVGFVHSRGLSLGGIKPSSVFLTHEHHIFLPDAEGLCPDAAGHKGNTFDKESYDYAAPEQCFKPTKSAPTIRRHNNVPEANSFSISRGRNLTTGYGEPLSSTATQQAINPHFNAQAADIFSLGCVILNLLSHGLFKRRSSTAFAAHRAAKHKSAGRGGAIPDSSFHKNLDQVESWMAGMAKDAAKKVATGGSNADKHRLYAAVAPLLHVVEKMLALQASERPTAVQVQSWIYPILTEVSGIAEPHCVHQYAIAWDGTRDAAAAGHSTLSSGSSERMLIVPETTSLTDDQDDRTTVVEGTNTASRRSSVLGFVGRPHRRPTSDNSLASQGSIRSDQGERWEMGSGLRAIQNLSVDGKAKAWQSPARTDSVVSSGS